MKTVTVGALLVAIVTTGATPDAAAQQTPVFIHNFYADGKVGQCNGAAYGLTSAEMGQWTPTIRMDTDDRKGGCYQQFSIYDPGNMLGGLTLQVEFSRTGIGQCENTGLKTIPIHQNWADAIEKMSDAYKIDTDSRHGGCRQAFILHGRTDIALDIIFDRDGELSQCGMTQGQQTVTVVHPVILFLDMDNRPGGCRQSFRLRKL